MTRTERSTVVGVFTDYNQAVRAIDDLKRAGFNDDQIGYVMRDPRGRTQGDITPDERAGNTGSGAAAGAVSGGIIGGVIGAAASLLIPGFGPAIAGGILAATLGGVVIGAAAGGIIGALTNMGIPEEEARYYQGEFEAGRIIVTVKAANHYQEAIDILRRNGAYDASTRMNSTVGTNAQPGTYNPNAQPGTYNPNAQQGSYNPNVQPGTYNPNAQAGTYNPNAQAGTYNPNAQPGTYDLNAQQGTEDPNARTAANDNDGIMPAENPHRP